MPATKTRSARTAAKDRFAPRSPNPRTHGKKARKTLASTVRRGRRAATVDRNDQVVTYDDLLRLAQGDTADRRGADRDKQADTFRSTLHRNLEQLKPWGIAAGLTVAALLVELVVLISGARNVVAAFTTVIAVIAAVVIGRLVRAKSEERWRTRSIVWAIAGVGWLSWVAFAGLTWQRVVLLFLGTLCFALHWWQAHRHQHPHERPAEPVVDDEVEVVDLPVRGQHVRLWNKWIAADGCVLKGARLIADKPSEPSTTPEPAAAAAKEAAASDTTTAPVTVVPDPQRLAAKVARYTVQLVPGKQSIDTVMSNKSNIDSGLLEAPENVIFEKHPGKDSSLLRLSILEESPVAKGIKFTGPQWYEDGYDAWIEPGWYADGNGRVRIPVLALNSTRNLMIFGGQGSGKTSLLNLLAVSALASRRAVVWYLDGQDGASSPQLLHYADWAPEGDKAGLNMLLALERLYKQRADLLKMRHAQGINPGKGKFEDIPLLIVVVDECHEIWRPGSQYIKRWEDLIRKGRKLGVVFWAATQHPKLDSFGGEDGLRSMLMQFTTMVLRMQGKVAKNIVGMDMDPEDLPEDGGYGYLLAGSKSRARSAMFRADHLDDTERDKDSPRPAGLPELHPYDPAEAAKSIADQWFEHVLTQAPALDTWSAVTLPDAYKNRHTDAERERTERLREYERVMNGHAQGALFTVDEQIGNGGDDITGGAEADNVIRLPRPPQFPSLYDEPAPSAEPDEQDSDADLTAEEAQVLAVIRGSADPVHVDAVKAATDLNQTYTYDAIKALRKAGLIHRAGKGRYAAGPDPDTHSVKETTTMTTTELETCADCGVAPGQPHLDGCDWACCPDCGEQLLMHEECDPQRPAIWHGIDPYVEAAQQRGWQTTIAGVDEPMEDSNRAVAAKHRGELVWDPQTQRLTDPSPDPVVPDTAPDTALVTANGGLTAAGWQTLQTLMDSGVLSTADDDAEEK